MWKTIKGKRVFVKHHDFGFNLPARKPSEEFKTDKKIYNRLGEQRTKDVRDSKKRQFALFREQEKVNKQHMKKFADYHNEKDKKIDYEYDGFNEKVGQEKSENR